MSLHRAQFPFLLGILIVLWADLAPAQVIAKSEIQTPRQVTAMTIRAVRGTGPIDPKLASVADRLTQVLPGYHFALIEGRTVRLENGMQMKIAAGPGSELQVLLKQSLNSDGKVELALRLNTAGQKPFEPVVNSPPNQLFFVDRKIRDNERLLIAVGAR